MAAVVLDLFDHTILDAGIGDNGLLRRTECAVVKALAGKNVLNGLRDVSRGFHIGGDIARTHPEGGLSHAVGGLDKTMPSGSQDQGSLAMTHQLPCSFDSGLGQAPNRSLGRAGCDRGLRQDSAGLPDTARSRGVGTENDGVAALERNQGLVDGGGSRVGGGNDRGNDPDRRGDLQDSFFSVLSDDADRPEVFDGLVDKLGAEFVLEDLVGDVAETGFLHGHAGKLLGSSQPSLGHLSNHGIDLVLGETRETCLSLKCLFKQ